MSDQTVGRIEFEPHSFIDSTFSENSNLAARLKALASGLGKLSEVLVELNGKMDKIISDIDKLSNRRWIDRNQ